MDPLVLTLAAVVGLALGALSGFLLAQSRERARREREKVAAKDEASAILGRAKTEADNLRRSRELEGKEEAMRLRDAWEQEETRRREEVERLERRLLERTESLDKKFDALNDREQGQERR
jgi:ribonuclease Y